MPVLKKETPGKGTVTAIVSSKVRSHVNDPFFLKKNDDAREALSKTDLSALKKK